MMRFVTFIPLLFCISLSNIAGGQEPEPRWAHGICYDSGSKTVLMFGGSGYNGYFGDLWSLSNGKWKKLSNSGPAPRHKFAFTYDKKRHRAVLFGGSGAKDELFSDTWEWDGSEWKKIDVEGPSKRDHPLGAYDPVSETIIIKGGFNSSGLLTDTWSFNGSKWTQLLNAGTAGHGLAHGMFVDQSANLLNLITVETGDQKQPYYTNTWWVLKGNKWEPSSKKFPATSNQSIQAISAYGEGGLIVFDGDNVKNNKPTTAWFSGRKWNSKKMNGTRPRVGHAMIWDPSNRFVVLFGGFDREKFFNDTWIWQHKKWIKL